MMINTLKFSRFIPIFYWFFCVFYIVFFGPYGFEDTDTGYIFGSSWNIYNHTLPHRDFIYTRPAIPAFFHSLFLYVSETYGYLIDRAFFYVQIFTYSLLSLKIIHHIFPIANRYTLYFLALLGAIICIHNYPPMGWNTTDGIFFWVLGLYFILTKEQKIAWFLGVCFALLGTLSKQSFFFMPLFLAGYLVYLKQWKKLIILTGFGILWFGVYILLKYSSGSLLPMWEQIFTRTGGSDFINSSIKPYYVALKANWWQTFLLLVTLLLLRKIQNKNLIFTLGMFLFSSYFVYWFYTLQQLDAIPYIMQILWVFSVVFMGYKLLKDSKYSILLLLLALSWSAAISNGYRTPILYATPFVMVFVIWVNNEISNIKFNGIAALSLLLLLATFTYGYQFPYRDSNRNKLTKNMGEVFPQLHFIKSDEETYAKYSELKSLSQHYSNFTVVPSMCLAHYLTKTVNPIGTDWLLDVEINDESEQYIEELYRKQVTLFVEKDITDAYAKENYKLLLNLDSRWELTQENDYFKIYEPKDN